MHELLRAERWIAPLAGLACWLAWPPLLLAWTPGIALVPRRAEGERDPLVRAVEIVGASFCVWAAAFWFLRWVPIPLEAAFQAVAIVAIGVHALRPRPEPAPPLRELLGRIPLAGLLAAAAIVWLRLLPMVPNPAPPGGDMSMHTYVTELIVRANGVPASYRPILPIDSFETFPVGFHVVSALISLAGELPSYRSAFLVSCLSHAFVSFALFALLRVHTAPLTAGLAAFAVLFVANAPQGMVSWGGNPTVLAIALAGLLAASLARFERWRDADAALAGLFLAGLAGTHTIVLVQAFYLLGVPLLVALAFARPWQPVHLRRLAVFAATFALVSAPYLLSLDRHALTPEVRAWIEHWVRGTDHAWRENTATAPLTIPSYALAYLGGSAAVFLPLAALGLGPLWRRDPRALALQLAFVAMAFLLILNTRYWWLPLSPLIYPERVATMLILPLGVLAAVGLESFLAPAPGRWPRLAFAAALATTIVVAWRPYDRHYLHAVSRHASVRAADLRAFAWLDRNAAPGDVIETQYGDAGIWIPGILFRPVTEAHVNVAFLHGLEYPAQGRFRYVGSRCVYECKWSTGSPPPPSEWREVHADGPVRIYERVTAPVAAAPGG